MCFALAHLTSWRRTPRSGASTWARASASRGERPDDARRCRSLELGDSAEARSLRQALPPPDPHPVAAAGHQAAAADDARAGGGARPGGDGEPAARGGPGPGDALDRGDRPAGGQGGGRAQGRPAQGDRGREVLRGVLRRRPAGEADGGPRGASDREHAHRVAGPLRPPPVAAAHDGVRRAHDGDRRRDHPEPRRGRPAADAPRGRGQHGPVPDGGGRAQPEGGAVARPGGGGRARPDRVPAHPAAGPRPGGHRRPTSWCATT